MGGRITSFVSDNLMYNSERMLEILKHMLLRNHRRFLPTNPRKCNFSSLPRNQNRLPCPVLCNMVKYKGVAALHLLVTVVVTQLVLVSVQVLTQSRKKYIHK